MLLVRLPVNSRLLVVKFLRSQKLYMDFQLHGKEAMSLTPRCSRVNFIFWDYINHNLTSSLTEWNSGFLLKRIMYVFYCKQKKCNFKYLSYLCLKSPNRIRSHLIYYDWWVLPSGCHFLQTSICTEIV